MSKENLLEYGTWLHTECERLWEVYRQQRKALTPCPVYDHGDFEAFQRAAKLFRNIVFDPKTVASPASIPDDGEERLPIFLGHLDRHTGIYAPQDEQPSPEPERYATFLAIREKFMGYFPETVPLAVA